MTLSLRRKRQTTAPNTPAATDYNPIGDREPQSKTRWSITPVLRATLLASCGLVAWGIQAEEYAGAVQSAVYRPAPKSNGKLNWLPYQPEKVKSDPEVRAVQYSTTLPNDAWSAQKKTPTPAVRPTPGKTVPPNTLGELPEDQKPALLPAPPTELDQPLSEPPTELASEGEAAIPPPAFPAERMPDTKTESNNRSGGESPGWTPSNAKPNPNEPNGYSGNHATDKDKDPNKSLSEYLQKRYCLSVKDLKKISEIGTDITAKGEVPKDCPWGDERKFAGRSWQPLTFTWTASSLCHKPLYFEDVHLERYGHMLGPWVQPIVSHARFFAIVPILPYEMGLEPPHECIYVLGHYRPGSCAPYYIDPIPLSVRAALFEGGAVTAAVIAIP